MRDPRAPNVLLVYPRFAAATFWNFAATCELLGVKYPAAPLGLITTAAMFPPSWTVRLVDRNAEELTAANLDWADMVMTGGMLAQHNDTAEVIFLQRSLSQEHIGCIRTLSGFEFSGLRASCLPYGHHS